MSNIFPIKEGSLESARKEGLLNQKGMVVWMVGLSGSGKSTLAQQLEKNLFEKGRLTMLLDGDNLRTGINKNLGFSDEDRIENIRRAAEVSKLFAYNGIVTICSLISPTDIVREMARKTIGDKYFEVFVDCPLEVCEKRDVKGLYHKARQGLIKDFTGIDSVFEAPQNADLVIDTSTNTIEESVEKLLKAVLPLVKL